MLSPRRRRYKYHTNKYLFKSNVKNVFSPKTLLIILFVVVCKVLSHEDPSLLLEEYKRELEAFALMTAGNCSVAAFRIVELRPSFAFIVRQYVRYSVYERLQTRPFLSQLGELFKKVKISLLYNSYFLKKNLG